MATPHIAGAMALLWSAIPSLQHQLTASRDALNNSAVHIDSTLCGDAGPPNNVYGWGRVDIFAAVGGGTPTPTPLPLRRRPPRQRPVPLQQHRQRLRRDRRQHPGRGHRQGRVPRLCPGPRFLPTGKFLVIGHRRSVVAGISDVG